MNAIGEAAVRRVELEVLERGRPLRVEGLEIDGQAFRIERGLVTTVRLEHEWYEDVHDPERVLQALRAAGVRADLFTFWQRLPDLAPRHPYRLEREAIAALPVSSYAQWCQQRIRPRVRGQIRKARQDGVELREAQFDDAFVDGMTRIFNESPVRQGRPFWHYGKDADTVRRQFSRYLFRERLVGAYHRGEMIGFMMLGDAGSFALTGQIIASLHHRDKCTNLMLVDRAVAMCESLGWRHLVYCHWTHDSLGEFKRRCGFEPTEVPRYFVPLSAAGRWALACGLHRGARQALPEGLRQTLRGARARWYDWRGLRRDGAAAAAASSERD
jgi:hypothetical protein